MLIAALCVIAATTIVQSMVTNKLLTGQCGAIMLLIFDDIRDSLSQPLGSGLAMLGAISAAADKLQPLAVAFLALFTEQSDSQLHEATRDLAAAMGLDFIPVPISPDQIDVAVKVLGMTAMARFGHHPTAVDANDAAVNALAKLVCTMALSQQHSGSEDTLMTILIILLELDGSTAVTALALDMLEVLYSRLQESQEAGLMDAAGIVRLALQKACQAILAGGSVATLFGVCKYWRKPSPP